MSLGDRARAWALDSGKKHAAVLLTSQQERMNARIAKMDTRSLVEWADLAIAGIARGFGDWMSKGIDDGLDEARMGTAALQAVLDELSARKAAGPL